MAIYTRIPHLELADTPESRGNAAGTADSFFHPSRPSGLGHLIQRKGLILPSKSAPGDGRTPIHPGNPGYIPIRCLRSARSSSGRIAWSTNSCTVVRSRAATAALELRCLLLGHADDDILA